MKKLLIGMLAIGSISAFASESCNVKIKNNVASTVSQDEIERILYEKGYTSVADKSDINLSIGKTNFGNKTFITAELALSEDDQVSVSSIAKYSDLLNFNRDGRAKSLRVQRYDSIQKKEDALKRSEQLSEASKRFHERKTSRSLLKALNNLPFCTSFIN